MQPDRGMAARDAGPGNGFCYSLWIRFLMEYENSKTNHNDKTDFPAKQIFP